MRIKDVIRAPKTSVVIDEWAEGRMDKSAFPLSRSGKTSLRLGSGFDWRVARFEALGLKFKIVVAGGTFMRDAATLVSYQLAATRAIGNETFLATGRTAGR